jgi:Tfp pilus assembly protein PilF
MKANPARNGVSKARILRRTLFLLPALLLGTFSFGRTATQNESSPRPSSDELLEQHLGKGYEALKQEKYGDAGEEFRAALGIDPTLVMRARFPRRSHGSKNTKPLKRAVNWKPRGRSSATSQASFTISADSMWMSTTTRRRFTNHYLGLAYARDGNTQDAEKWLKEAVRLHPDDSRRATGEGLEELRPRST